MNKEQRPGIIEIGLESLAEGEKVIRVLRKKARLRRLRASEHD
jgi:hypothetical protein